MTWWEEFPERLVREQRDLESADITYERDEAAWSQGILRWRLQLPLDSERIPLDVTFPELYPYFRFQIEAPTLSLGHHQNPFAKNLCLIGRGTHHWNTTDTVAALLMQQLPLVLQSGQSDDRAAVRDVEQQQAEPFSDYYPCPASLVIIPTSSLIPPPHVHGTFTVAPAGPPGPLPEQFVKGLLSQVRDSDGRLIFEASPALRSAFTGPLLEGAWARLSKPIMQVRQDQFLRELLERCPAMRRARPNKVAGGWLQIWAVVFPEESAWRAENGEGWIFVCLFNSQQTNLVRPLQPPAWHVGMRKKCDKKKRKQKRRR